MCESGDGPTGGGHCETGNSPTCEDCDNGTEPNAFTDCETGNSPTGNYCDVGNDPSTAGPTANCDSGIQPPGSQKCGSGFDEAPRRYVIVPHNPH